MPQVKVERARATAWILGQGERATQLLDSAVEQHPPGSSSALGWRWLEVSQVYAIAGEPGKARKYLQDFERLATPSVARYSQQALEETRGWVALAERRYDDAIRDFRKADVDQCLVCALAPLAHAYDLAGQSDSAIASFERYLSTHYFYRTGQDGYYLAGTYKRLGELYDAKGDKDRALMYYDRFVDLWKNADPELQPRVQEVRRRAQTLRRTSG
jgi:tetratricopeptide (TPR) repeat protein